MCGNKGASHHVEDRHHQDEGHGRHGEDQSQPRLVGNDDGRGRGQPGEEAEGALACSLLSTQTDRPQTDRPKRVREADDRYQRDRKRSERERERDTIHTLETLCC